MVPAYNEAENIGTVLAILKKCPRIDEIIVVDDGSADKTSQVAAKYGVTVIKQKNQGKGVAMKTGVKATDAPYIFFADADILGFNNEHLEALARPVIEKNAMMTVGLRDRGSFLVWLLPKIAPVLGGERVMPRELFLSLSGPATRDFGIETVMNAYCAKKHLAVEYVSLKGVTQVIKEKKYGWWRGFRARVRMVGQILRAEWGVMRMK